MQRVSSNPQKTGERRQSRVVQRLGDRRITLYRRKDIEHGSWFLCVYLREEKRQYRVSLKTDDREQAKRKAEAVLIDLLGKVRNGERILSPSLGDVLRAFEIRQQQGVAGGQISPRTVALQRYRIRRGFEFLKTHYPAGLATKIAAVDGDVFKEYLPWRQALRASKGADKTIRRDVVRDELLAIRKVFKFAHTERLCPERSIPRWYFEVERSGPTRRRITQRDYTHFLNCIRSWKGKARNAKDRYHRELLQHFVLVVANTGLRTGELLALRNRDVQIRDSAKECLLTVRPETSKVRRGRQITMTPSYGGKVDRATPINYLIRWIRERQMHKDPADFVFAPFTNGKKLARDVYYHVYKQLRSDLKDLGLEWFDTYHCRHFWITNRLYAGEPIHLVAKAAGTSVSEIEQTYSNVLTELITKQFGERRVVYSQDGSPIVIATKPERPARTRHPRVQRKTPKPGPPPRRKGVR
jgi:integrase